MSDWCRVFGSNDVEPNPDQMLAWLRRQGMDILGKFDRDDLGWFRAELRDSGDASSIEVDRYLAGEDSIRADLNTWAAWLETVADNPVHIPLMQRVIGTKQLMSIPLAGGDGSPRRLALLLCQWLAGVTDGIYQMDGAGFFSADGALLLQE